MKEGMDNVWLSKGVVLQSSYQIRKKIAISELSIVYLSYDLVKRKHCIIKEYFPRKIVLRDLDHQTVVCRKSLMKEKYYQARNDFFSEYQIIKRYNHPNIAKGLDSFVTNNTGYIVLEYYQGKTLDEYIETQKEISIVKFLKQIFISLIYTVKQLHQDGIIHRDLKPTNIIVSPKGTPVIIDFGSAIYYQYQEHKKIFVTPGFSPIEYYSEKTKQGKYSDLYSLAAILYYYLTGRAPLVATNRLHEDKIEGINSLCEEISGIFGCVIMKNLAFDYHKRFNDLNAFEFFIKLECLFQTIKSKIKKI